MSKPTTNPFPGLRPFQKNESHLFFGRENHINEILRKLDAFRFVSIVGNSGSGKSSLVRAGILPKIENREDKSWLTCIMRPGKNPVLELCTALFDKDLFGNSGSGEREKQVEGSVEILNKSRLGLVQVVRNQLPEGKQLLILVDQFEEIFRFNSIYLEQNNLDAASHFVELLLGAVGQKEVPVYIIMTVLSDFLGDCEQFTGLPEAINDGQFLIPRMNREEMQKSITGPVDLANGKISPHLVHQLLNEVGRSPDQLPVLQHVLMRTWEVWEHENNTQKPIDTDTYNKTGGIQKALSNHAEEAFAELNTDRKKKLAESIFKTITLKGADNRGIRRPTSLSKVVGITQSSLPEIIEIVNIFRRADRGFLMPPANIDLNPDSVLDISHESLMRVWERLGTWVEEEADSAGIYHRICESALLYDKNMAGLWRDPDLQIAVDWREENKPNKFWADQYNDHFDLAIRFIDASIQDKKFRLSEKNRRTNLTRIVVSIFLIALSTLALWANRERNRSATSAKLAMTEKDKAEKQEAFANEQKKVAQENSLQAQKEKANAVNEKGNADEQRKIAELNAIEAEIQKKSAQRASLLANDARRAAELDKQIAELQKQLSDSMKTVALNSEKNAYRLRILTIAQTLAIKSAQAVKGTYNDDIKPLLALQAHKFNTLYNGKNYDPDIISALFSSVRFLQNRSDYVHNHHSDAVRSIAFSNDGKYIASMGNEGKLIVAEAADLQKTISGFPAQPLLIENIQFNADGSKIYASADNKSILVYTTNSSSQMPRIIDPGHTDKISGLVYFDDHLISASFDKSVKLIDAVSGKVIKTMTLESKPVAMCIHKPSKKIVIGCENGIIYLADIATFKEAQTLVKLPSGRITAIDFHRSGETIALGTSEGNVLIIHIKDPEKDQVTILAHKSSITGIKFNPAANFLASCSLDGTIKLWNLAQVEEQPVIFTEHDSWVLGIAFNPNGKLLASAGKDKTVRPYIVSQEDMIHYLESKVKRNLTTAEWSKFIGADIPYEKTIRDR